MTEGERYVVKDASLAEEGKKRIEWAKRDMGVLVLVAERIGKEKPFSGIRIGGCLHITVETANLAIALKEAGAEVFLCASNPLSTQDDVAAALAVLYDIPVFAFREESTTEYYMFIHRVLDHHPQLVIDDGADLMITLAGERSDVLPHVRGGTEETTTGVNRLRQLHQEKRLSFPVIAVNSSATKYLFDNRYGTGQSAFEGILRATHILIAGKKVAVAGYGWVGRGIAWRARGLGARVVVTEVHPIRALEAVMDGFEVLPMKEAAEDAEVFITATGNYHIIRPEHFDRMKDGVYLANAGHFDVEIDVASLRQFSSSVRRVNPYVEEFVWRTGKRLYLLAEGRLVNLAAAEGHPSSVMDLSFANQFLALHYLLKHPKMAPGVYTLPEEIDLRIARWKLETMGIRIDTLTREQKEYLASYRGGTT
ncbi:MAG: adenosylhomocysteinase [bacterium JZ-2024 1]